MTKSPDAFRTISEVADWLGVQTHVLRFWESKFTQVKPVKRAGGRRYYRPADMLLLGGIRKLLHDDGLTIKGVQKILREDGMAHVADMSQPLDDETAGALDGDLVARVGDDVEMPTAPERSPIDQSPLRDGPFGGDNDAPDQDEDDDQNDDAEPGFAPAAAPEFLHPAEANATEKPSGDIAPTLPSDDPAPDAPSEVAARTPSQPPADATPPPHEDEVAPQDIAEEVPHIFDAPFEDPATAPPADPFPSDWTDTAHEDAPDAPIAALAASEAAAPEVKAMGGMRPTPDTEETSASDTPARRARVVHAPDEVETDTGDTEPSALAKALRLNSVTPAQADALRPLVAQLTALRDQMARARHNQT